MLGQIGRCIDQEPTMIVSGNRDTRLQLRADFSGTRGGAVCAGTIPLGKATASGTSKNADANRSTLGRSNRARVAGALEKDRQTLQAWFDPPFFGPFHRVINILRRSSLV